MAKLPLHRLRRVLNDLEDSPEEDQDVRRLVRESRDFSWGRMVPWPPGDEAPIKSPEEPQTPEPDSPLALSEEQLAAIDRGEAVRVTIEGRDGVMLRRWVYKRWNPAFPSEDDLQGLKSLLADLKVDN